MYKRSHSENRLQLIIQTIPMFWEKKRYPHFTNHGPLHSERVYNILQQIVEQFPDGSGLNPVEEFIVSAAAWLYEVGFQSPNLRPVLAFDYEPTKSLSHLQLLAIRDKKHLLSYNLIHDNFRVDSKREPLNLGLIQPADRETFMIAEVCRWCSNEPLAQVPERDVVDGTVVRLRLLVALLRLADQLYIDSMRVRFDLLESAGLPESEFSRWRMYRYIQTLPIENGQIRFYYFIPFGQQEYIGQIRALIEPDFEIQNNPNIQYLSEAHHLNLLLMPQPNIRLDTTGFQIAMEPDLLRILDNMPRVPSSITTYEDGNTINLEGVISRIQLLEDRLGYKLNNLKLGQAFIYSKIQPGDTAILGKILDEIHRGRIEQGELRKIMDATRRSMKYVLDRGVKIDDPEFNKAIAGIYESGKSGLSLEQQFELTLPVIPFLVNYKLNLGGGVDLGAVWKELNELSQNISNQDKSY